MSRLVFHGSNKSEEELRTATELGVARVVVDSFDELARIQRIAERSDSVPPLWLRVTPGIDAHTHEHVRTGHDDTKFGFTLSLGLADAAVERTAADDRIEVAGVHAHIGSQIFGAGPFIANVEVMIEAMARWRERCGVVMAELNIGGGIGIRYTHEDRPISAERYGAAVLTALEEACDTHDYPRPRLWIEPGRAIVGPSTITVYRVGTVKEVPGIRTFVSVDGGMSDNIRPSLYGAEHEVELANRLGSDEHRAVTVVGKHCESGDLVRERASLPADLVTGDLLAVAATGAYTEAMASNYNRLPRPAAVVVRDGRARELIRRETYDDLTRRDVPLSFATEE